MKKSDYIIKQFSKTNKKNFENYVVSRIWHYLNRTDIKFVTQQYVYRPGGYALTDMYFPQCKLHIEVDEAFHQKQKIHDISRQADIIQATSHEIFRIKITDKIEDLNKQIDDLVRKIHKEIEKQESDGTFEPWDIDLEYSPEYHLKKGYLDVSEDPAFRKSVDASNCLGQEFKGVRRAWFKSKKYSGYYLWFPKFYENTEWDNKINANGNIITEMCKTDEKKEKWFKGVMENPVHRITFPQSIDNLRVKLYRFKGIFRVDKKDSNINTGILYRLENSRLELE